MKKTNHPSLHLHHRVAQQASRLRCVRSICCGALLHKKKILLPLWIKETLMLVENSTGIFLGMQGMQAVCVRPHLNSNREAVRGMRQSNLATAVAVKVKFRVALD
jgi:hypothetical protein